MDCTLTPSAMNVVQRHQVQVCLTITAKIACIDQVKQLWPMLPRDGQGLQPRFHAPFPSGLMGVVMRPTMSTAFSGEPRLVKTAFELASRRASQTLSRRDTKVVGRHSRQFSKLQGSQGLSTAVKSTGSSFFCTWKMLAQCDVPETGHHIGKTRVLEVTLISD